MIKNKLLDLSILIKTFIRPQCLENILESIEEYQKYNNVNFACVVIIDDSDDEHKNINHQIVNKYKKTIKINYKRYPFNSLGLSKGRNVGVKEINTKYFLLCDDDFIFDKKCSFERNINLIEEKNVDILGGIYRNISSKNDIGTDYNWLGFIRETEDFDVCDIFTDIFPKFCCCDIVENFYIAKRKAFDLIQYPEDMPLLEHNVFFLRAKQAGIKVAFTNNLWVKHLHITNKNKSYEGYRNRQVVNPIKKRVIGFLHTGNDIVRFYDYLNVMSKVVYTKKTDCFDDIKNIKVVQVIGGMGNQMFQYAFARAIGDDVKLDITTFDKYKTWDYLLDVFNIKENYATDAELDQIKHKSKSKFPKLIRKMLGISKFKSNEIKETDLSFNKELLQPRDVAYYVGYFQCEKYFKDIRTKLLEEFSLRKKLDNKNIDMLKQINSTNAVAIHVRRGDYVELQHVHGLCNLDYYKRGIDYICKHVENPHFFVFSDDMDWVKNNLEISSHVTYVDINDKYSGYFDLELMKNCKHNIIANSSFSWWGAWLNENPDKIVIAPKQWFANGNKIDIVCDDWIKL